jgi:hypothetical protein
MNDVIKSSELEHKILNKLLNGESEESICKELNCDIFATQSVLGSDIFATLSGELIEKRLKSAALRSVAILSQLSNDETIGANPRIRAAEILLSKSLEIKELQGVDESPATMSQDKLKRRLNELQKEVNERAKPVDNGVIDMDDMLT